jgi:Carboxypeptidase regulatory-like domain/TonB dependent receptor-like, beta-barrel
MPRIKVTSTLFFFSFLVVLCASVALAQLPTGTILGVVHDSSGGVVPDATVTIRSTDTGLVRTITTGADGAFRVPALPVGQYTVKVEKTGFQSVTQTGLSLAVGQELVSNSTLQVGSSTQEVVVSAEAPVVNTTNGTLGGLVNEQRIADLPLNGRNYIDLTLLQPGITQHRNVGANPSNAGLWYSSNGAPVHSNNYLLDGARMNNLQGVNGASAAGYTLGVDGIQEYRIITNNFSAEYGMSMGSQVVAVSKGGTNNWHGDAFDYLRNSSLDARNFYDAPPSLLGRRLPQFQRNDLGGSIGGPIKKDNTFFYAVYEGVRQRQGLTTIDSVMPAGCHQNLVLNTTTGNYNFATDADATACASGLTSLTVIPASIKPLLDLYPAPNLPKNQFTYPFTAPTRDDYGQIRVDHTFSPSDTMFVRYTIDNAASHSAVIALQGPFSYPGFTMDLTSQDQFVTLSENHVFSPAVVNTARFSISRTTPAIVSGSPYTGSQYAFVPADGTNDVGAVNIGGISPLGPFGVAPIYTPQTVFTWSDDLFYTHGNHSLKFGTLINRFRQYNMSGRGSHGTVTFPNLPAFMSGTVQSYSYLGPGSATVRDYRFTTIGFYAQDDYRVTPRFTLNLGVRYEFMTQMHEVHGIQSALIDPQFDAAPTVGIPFKNPTLHNYSPRVGFAWDIMGDGKTSVRGGFALLYDLTPYGTAMDVIQPNAKPFAFSATVLGGTFAVPFPAGNPTPDITMFDYNLKSQHILDYNLTIERQLPFSMGLSVGYAGSKGLDLMSRRDVNPTIPQGVPDANGNCVALPSGQAVDLTSLVDGSATACWLGTEPHINPNWTSVILQTDGAFSAYNALEVLLTKRLSSNLQFQSSYTFSKLMDDVQAEAPNELNNAPVYPVDAFNTRIDYGPSSYDVTHNWRFNAIYQLPRLSSAKGALDKLVNGWSMSGVLSLQNGYPFTVNLQTNRSRSQLFDSAANMDRPNLVSGRSIASITQGVSTSNGIDPCPTAGQTLGTPDLWFDPCAFTIPHAGFLGNAPRNFLRGPGLSNLDFSVLKDTAIPKLGESGRLEFRAEFFNILNRANFAMPGNRNAYAARGNVESPLSNSGVILSTYPATSRQIQFALKLLF